MSKNVRKTSVQSMLLVTIFFGVISFSLVFTWCRTAKPSFAQTANSSLMEEKPKLILSERHMPTEEELDALAILWAIRENEQDKNIKFPYDSYNPSGAYGIVQMTEGSLKSWSKQLLGREMSMQEYLQVDTQKEFSYKVIQAFLKRYRDPQIVCSCWQSPRTNFNSTVSDGHWTVRKYVEECVKTLKGLRPQMVNNLKSEPWVDEVCRF